jgi:hypothetical protein
MPRGIHRAGALYHTLGEKSDLAFGMQQILEL